MIRPSSRFVQALCVVVSICSISWIGWAWSDWVLEGVVPQGAFRVSTAAVSPGGYLRTGIGRDGAPRVWVTEDGTEQVRFGGHDGIATAAGFSPSGDRVVSVGVDGSAQLWDSWTGETLVRHRGAFPLLSANFNVDGRSVVVAGESPTVVVFDATSGAVLHELDGHDDAVADASFSPDGDQIVTASWDGVVRVWPVVGETVSVVLEPALEQARWARFSADGRRILAGRDDTAAIVWVRRYVPEWGVLFRRPEIWSLVLSLVLGLLTGRVR